MIDMDGPRGTGWRFLRRRPIPALGVSRYLSPLAVTLASAPALFARSRSRRRSGRKAASEHRPGRIKGRPGRHRGVGERIGRQALDPPSWCGGSRRMDAIGG
jgi:hypothetical protein